MASGLRPSPPQMRTIEPCISEFDALIDDCHAKAVCTSFFGRPGNLNHSMSVSICFHHGKQLLIVTHPLLFNFNIVFYSIKVNHGLGIAMNSNNHYFIFPQKLFFRFQDYLSHYARIRVRNRNVRNQLILFRMRINVRISQSVIQDLDSLKRNLFADSGSKRLAVRLFGRESSSQIFKTSFIIQPLKNLKLARSQDLAGKRLTFCLSLTNSVDIGQINSKTINHFSLQNNHVSILQKHTG